MKHVSNVTEARTFSDYSRSKQLKRSKMNEKKSDGKKTDSNGKYLTETKQVCENEKCKVRLRSMLISKQMPFFKKLELDAVITPIILNCDHKNAFL